MVHRCGWRFAHFDSRRLSAKPLKNPVGPQVLLAICFVRAEQTLLRHSLNLTCWLGWDSTSRHTLLSLLIFAPSFLSMGLSLTLAFFSEVRPKTHFMLPPSRYPWKRCAKTMCGVIKTHSSCDTWRSLTNAALSSALPPLYPPASQTIPPLARAYQSPLPAYPSES